MLLTAFIRASLPTDASYHIIRTRVSSTCLFSPAVTGPGSRMLLRDEHDMTVSVIAMAGSMFIMTAQDLKIFIIQMLW